MNREEIAIMPAGVEIDRLMAKLMGWEQITTGLNYLVSMGTVVVFQPDGVWKFAPGLAYLWSPSRDIAAAWEVLEKLAEMGAWLNIGKLSGYKTWDVRGILNEGRAGERRFINHDESLPLAICRVALLAEAS